MNKRSLLTVFLLLCFYTYAQNQSKADSLINKYNSGSYEEDELELLKLIAQDQTSPNKQIEYAELLIQKASVDSSFNYLLNGYLHKGNGLKAKGENPAALEAFIKALDFAHRSKNESNIGILNIAIAGAYSSMNNSRIAKGYYLKGIKILRKHNDSINTGSALLNAGDEYFNSGDLDSALILTNESVLIFKNLDYPIGRAYSLGNLGMIYAEEGHDSLAEKNITEAIHILETLKDYYPISVYLTFMSDIYLRKGNSPQALKYAKRSLDLAQKYGLKEQISGANLKLSEVYEHDRNFEASNMYLKNYYSYRDSVLNIETVGMMADLRTNMEVSQKQTEVDLLLEKQKNQRITVIATIIALVLIIVLAAGLFRRNRYIQKTSALVEKEKDRSDKLLLNILPEETALELKDSGKVIPKKFDSVTVMFTDFRAFTKYSQYLTPELLVKSVDYHFSKFDEIMEKYGLEKIKTMGDAYMCAGGLPFPSEGHAEKMLHAAFEIIAFIDNIKNDDVRDISHFDIRIGIHTGPVVAGVVGIKKFAYDIWGDTVNIASRMESNSEPGRINVSERTYELINDKFDCEYRGEIQAKNKGMMKMYFANGLKHQTIPNVQSKNA